MTNRPIVAGLGFTLVELLVVLAIVGLLASTVLFAMMGAQENARVARTRSQIKRIDALISQKWEDFETVRLSIRGFAPTYSTTLEKKTNQYRATNTGRDPSQQLVFQWIRVDSVREYMRMTLPDRMTDLVDDRSVLSSVPTIWTTYRRRAVEMIANHRKKQPPTDNEAIRLFLLDESPPELQQRWHENYQTAECLYLILSTIVEDDRMALEFFSENEIGDLDDDGMPEILDAWGQPIYFIRWAPGFAWTSKLVNGEIRKSKRPDTFLDPTQPDPFDPLQQYPDGFLLYPLIISGGPDKNPDIRTDFGDDDLVDPKNKFSYAKNNNNPFVVISKDGQQQTLGEMLIRDGVDSSGDNVHNQYTTTQVGSR